MQPSLVEYDFKKLKSKSIYFLSRREYSSKELSNKLLKYTDKDTLITEVIENLLTNGYLSNERYVKSLVYSKHKTSGINKLQYLLKSNGIQDDLITNELSDIRDSQLEICTQLFIKKFKEVESDTKQRQKQTRFLLYRGFEMSIIMQMFKTLS